MTTKMRDISLRALLLPFFFSAAAAWAQEPQPTAQTQPVPAAKVVLVTGLVTAATPTAKRKLHSGDQVNVGESVVTADNSYANLRFRDGGRVLLRPGTEFMVEDYAYAGPSVDSNEELTAKQQEAAPGRAFFRLVKGGFRAITGLLGKVKKQDYKVTTSVATIGIRGTDYEAILCEGDCPTEGLGGQGVGAADPVLLAAADTGARTDVAQADGDKPSKGLIVGVNSGGILVNTPRGTFQVDVGQFLLALSNGQAFILPVPPDSLLVNPTPSPDSCK